MVQEETPDGEILLRRPSPARGTLMMGSLLFVWAMLSGTVGPAEWSWIRVTLLLAASLALFVVTTVPELFIEGSRGRLHEGPHC